MKPLTFSQATRRDFEHIKQAHREFMRQVWGDPWGKIGGVVLALLFAGLLLAPWLMGEK